MTESKGVADHPERVYMEAMWKEGLRAAAINDWLEQQGYPPLKSSTLARYGQRYWTKDELGRPLTEVVRVETETEDLAGQLQELGKLGVVKKVAVRNSVTAAGAETSSTMIEVIPSSSAPVLERGPAPKIKLNYKVAKAEPKPDGWKVGVFLPDMQIGYFKSGDGYVTTHDEAAIDVAHQIIADLEAKYGVDRIVNAGDNLDFPAFSSHRTAPGYLSTTQLAIDRAAVEVATQRSLAPSAEISWIEGNHEQRLTNFIMDKAPGLLGLTRAGETSPINSIAYLCRFDDYDVDLVGPYPDGELWVNEHLRFEHGSLYSSSPGATAAKYLKNGVSVGHGHTHRKEYLEETRHTAHGPRTHFAGSPGCLCRIDSKVPSSKTGVDARGTQSGKRAENWQNGLWIFWYQEDGKQLAKIEDVSIWGGWALHRGREFFSTVTPNGDTL